MNAFAAAESDLPLRIRRTLGGGARRMGTRARVLAAVLLGPLMVVTLPSCGTTGKRTGGDMAAEKVSTKESRDDEIRRVAHGELVARLRAHEPDSTIEELKARLRAQEPDNTIEEVLLVLGPPLALKWDTTIEEIAEAVRKRQEGGFPGSAEALIRTAVVVERAMATPEEEWTEDLKAEIERAGWDLEEFSKKIRSRRVWQEAMATDPDGWSEKLKARILALRAPEPERVNLFIVLDQDGSMKLSDKPVTFGTLKEELQAKRRLYDNTETIVIVIQGDEGALHGQIVKIMETARQAGLVDQVIASDTSHN